MSKKFSKKQLKKMNNSISAGSSIGGQFVPVGSETNEAAADLQRISKKSETNIITNNSTNKARFPLKSSARKS